LPNPDRLIKENLKNDERYKRIPIILITALAQKSDEVLMNNLGVEFYLKKPFELEQLADKIRDLLRL
jgi:DNA-binding response OmpR family regulator